MHVSSILIHVRQGNSHKIPVATDQSEAKITTISQSNKKDNFCCWEILELHSRKMHYTIAKIAHLSSTCPLFVLPKPANPVRNISSMDQMHIFKANTRF